jgi:hypothetical protein
VPLSLLHHAVCEDVDWIELAQFAYAALEIIDVQSALLKDFQNIGINLSF